MNKLNFDQFMEEFFGTKDTVTVNARKLQSFLISLNNEIQDGKMRIKQLEDEKAWFKTKAERLEQEQKGSYILDLKI